MTRRLVTVIVLTAALVASAVTVVGEGAASAGGPPAKTFTMTGTVTSVTVPGHQFTVLVGAVRYPVFWTAQTRFTLNARTATFRALRAGQSVTTTGVFRARWRVAVRVMLRTTAPTTTTTSATPPSASLTTALTEVIGQERYALATYQNVLAKLGSIPPFSNIAPSEQQHVSTITALMSAHGVTVPPATSTGAASPVTRVAACQLGVTIETGLIATYTKDVALVKAYPDVTLAFNHLLDAEQYGHLPAFLRCS